jgi:hypothetical protein
MHVVCNPFSPNSPPPPQLELATQANPSDVHAVHAVLSTCCRFDEEGITELLRAPALLGDPRISGTRNLSDNLSDLKAQVAGVEWGGVGVGGWGWGRHVGVRMQARVRARVACTHAFFVSVSSCVDAFASLCNSPCGEHQAAPPTPGLRPPTHPTHPTPPPAGNCRWPPTPAASRWCRA